MCMQCVAIMIGSLGAAKILLEYFDKKSRCAKDKENAKNMAVGKKALKL